MNRITSEVKDGTLTVFLIGRVDSNNAAETESKILEIVDANKDKDLVLDAAELEYISSAGLRIVLHFRKLYPDLKMINVNSDVYEILDMTGFTEMINVEKAYRVVSIEGCEEIGRGANGTVYRIDTDNVVKVYNNADALEDIQHEREVARLALVLGIPTAISYDVVRVNDSYGSVFELLEATSFTKMLVRTPEKMDWVVDEYIKLLKLIHGTVVPKGKLPDFRERFIKWGHQVGPRLPKELGDKLIAMIEAIPQDDHMIHGDYHTKNVMLQKDEVLLIDMDTICIGYPIFEFAGIYNAFVGYSEVDPDVIMQFQGFDQATGKTFWRKAIEAYIGTTDEEKVQAFEDKARILGYTRLIRRGMDKGLINTERGKKEDELWISELCTLLERTDTLLF